MNLIETPLTVVRVRWMCEKEGCTGEMTPTGATYPTNTALCAFPTIAYREPGETP